MRHGAQGKARGAAPGSPRGARGASPGRPPRRAGPGAGGFTLIEVALALLVVAIGLMAVFALFPAALDAARSTQNESRAAAFADEVFAAYQAQAVTGPWPALRSSSNHPPPAAHWGSDTRVLPNAGVQTVYFVPRPDDYLPGYRPSFTNADYALRCDLAVRSEEPRTASLRLRVWPGEFGPTNEADAFTFYSECYDYGM